MAVPVSLFLTLVRSAILFKEYEFPRVYSTMMSKFWHSSHDQAELRGF